MTTLFKTSAIIVTVLSAGLAGCQNKKTEVDRFQSSPPVIVQGGKSMDFKAWDLQSNKTMDLQDSIDTRKSGAVRSEITSRCSRDGEFLTETFNLPGQADLKVFQIIPIGFLSNELNSTVLQCAFTISLFNDSGSNHVFTTASIPITDGLQSNVRFQRGADEIISNSGVGLLVLSETAATILVRFDSTETSEATVSCQDMTISPMAFTSVIELSKFDLLNPVLNAGRPEGTLTSRPIQNCRVLFRQKGQLVAVSPAFKLRLQQKPFVSAVIAQPDPSMLDMEKAELEHLPKIYKSERVEYATVKVTNPTDGTRRIRFSKENSLGEISYYSGSQQGIREVFTDRYVSKTFESLGRTILTADDKYWYLAVPPNDSFQVQVYFQATKDLTCDAVGPIDLNSAVYFGFGLNAFDVEFDELLENNEVSRSWSVNLGNPFTFAMGKPYENTINNYVTHNPSTCTW